MNFGGISHIFKGINGTPELNRVVGAIGGLTFIFTTPAFVWWEIVHRSQPFDLVGYCLAFPSGIAALAGGTAAAIALKDRNVASATVTAQTGAIPAKPPAGPQVPVDEVTAAPASLESPPLAPPAAPGVEPADL
jgi:hypothetical protein